MQLLKWVAPAAIDQFNFNAFPRFATGGGYSSFDLRPYTNKEFTFLNAGRADMAHIKPYDKRLSGYAIENDRIFGTERTAAEAALADRKRKDAENEAFMNTIYSALISSGVSAGMAGFAHYNSPNAKFGRVTSAIANNPVNQKLSDYYEGKINLSSEEVATYSQISNNIMSNSKLPGYGGKQAGGVIRKFQDGGYQAYGSRLQDTIPAMLSGGEYMMKPAAVRKYGVATMDKMNSMHFQDGGAVPSNSVSTSSTSGVSSSSGNSFDMNININHQNDGGGQGGNMMNNPDFNKILKERMKTVALQTITEEQRVGGSLNSTKQRQ